MARRGPLDLQGYLETQRWLAAQLRAELDPAEIAEEFVVRVTTLFDFQAGLVWEAGPGRRKLRLLAAHGAGLDQGQVAELIAGRARERGSGIAGAAWAQGQMVVRASAGPRPFRAALAIPAPPGAAREVLAVLELFSLGTAALAGDSSEALHVLAEQFGALIAQRRLQRNAKSAIEFRAAALSSSPDCIIGMDHRGRITEFNGAAERLFGYRRKEALGRELAGLIVPEDLRERHRRGLQRFLETRRGVLLGRRFELPGRRRDGSTVPIELTVACDGSDPPVFMGFLRDVSDRGEAERIRRHLSEVVKGTQDAVLSKDLAGNVTTWNRGAEELYGYTEGEAVGRHISFLVPADHRNEEMEILERVKRGERLETYETERLRKDGARVNVALTISPIEHPVLGISGASVIARDVTSEKRRQRAQEFLIGATRILDSSLDPEQTARTIVETAVPELAELCVIDFARADGRIGDSIVAGADPEAARRLEEIRRGSPLDPEGEHPVAQVLKEDRPMVWRDLMAPDAIAQVAQNEEHRQLMSDAGYRSAAVVGLKARGRTIGALSLLHTSTDLRYDTTDLRFLSELGDRAAMALDNAILYKERDQIATNLQRGLRPPRPAQVDGLEIAVVFEAAGKGIEIGGDFYDVLPTEDGCWVLIGDVTGKGSAAAGVSVAVRHAVRGLTREIDTPEDVLLHVNELLLAGEGIHDFATAHLARMKREGGEWRVTLAAAGHPPAVHLTAAKPVQLGGGSMLGAFPDLSLDCHEISLSARESLVLCTDGWLEVGPPDAHKAPEAFAATAHSLAD
ncbi:MAG TPA: PAS domain S-box protein, partial [Solirubrobacterales bacterium]|nr:PAS domain S-box protein [Solirubrobacterales bacterium]